jgi:ribosome-associated protein
MSATSPPNPYEPDDRLAPGVDLREADVSFTFSRGGGPGGQNVNKVNTHATLTLDLDKLRESMNASAYDRLCRSAGRYLAADRLVIHASDHRSQLANRKACLAKLRRLLIEAQRRPTPRRKTKPSRASIERRLEAKRRRSKLKNLRGRVNRSGD